jgi:hypothetical protein
MSFGISTRSVRSANTPSARSASLQLLTLPDLFMA